MSITCNSFVLVGLEEGKSNRGHTWRVMVREKAEEREERRENKLIPALQGLSKRGETQIL